MEIDEDEVAQAEVDQEEEEKEVEAPQVGAALHITAIIARSQGTR